MGPGRGPPCGRPLLLLPLLLLGLSAADEGKIRLVIDQLVGRGSGTNQHWYHTLTGRSGVCVCGQLKGREGF